MRTLAIVTVLLASASFVMAQASPVPEIDGGTATSAIGLLTGALLVWRARRR